jgi:uncharacterized protein
MRALRYPFQLNSKGSVRSTDKYHEIVHGQVIDALMTNQGERVFRPRYGCDIQAALFDPVDELSRRDAASYIMARLEQFVTRATVRSVTVERSPRELSEVIIEIVYRITPLSPDVTLTMPISSEFINRQQQRQLREGVGPIGEEFVEEIPA